MADDGSDGTNPPGAGGTVAGVIHWGQTTPLTEPVTVLNTVTAVRHQKVRTANRYAKKFSAAELNSGSASSSVTTLTNDRQAAISAGDTARAAKLDAQLGQARATSSRLGGIADNLKPVAGRTAKTAEAVGKGFLGAAGTVVRRAAWWTTALFAARDIVNGYRAGGVSGAISAAGDAASTVAGGWAGAELGAMGGAALGGALGSVVPVLGTAVGATVGGFIGAVAGGFGGATLLAPHIKAAGAWLIGNTGQVVTEAKNGDVAGLIASGGSLLRATVTGAPLAGAPNANPSAPVTDAQAPQTAPVTGGTSGSQVGTAAAPATTPADVLAAAQSGVAEYAFNSSALAGDQQAALLTADKAALEQIKQLRATRSHAKINFGGQSIDFDGSQAGPVELDVAGHVDGVGATNSQANTTLAQMRADQAAAVLQQAITAEGMTNDVTVKAKGDGLGQGSTAQAQRNATIGIKLAGASA